MNRMRKLALAFSAVIPAVAMFGGTAFAGGDGAAQAVQYKDLVVNGKFDANIGGWTAGDYASIAWKEGRAHVYNTTPVAAVTSTHEVTQCVEIEPNSRPTFRGSIFIPENQVRTGSASFKLTYFKNDDCTDFKGNTQFNPLVTTGHWRHSEWTLDPMTAKDAKSVLIALQVTKNPTAPKNRSKKFVAVFDNIKLLQKVDPVKPDDDDKCEHICLEPGAQEEPDAPPPPAVDPEEDSEDEPAVEEPGDMPSDDEEPSDDSADLPGDEIPSDSGDDQTADDGDSSDTGDDAPSSDDSDTGDDNSGAGSSDQPDPGTGGTPSANGGSPTTKKPVEATSGGESKVIGGETSKPNTNNGGTASQTPLAPETGSTTQSAEDTTSTALFGGIAAGMATLGLLFAIILKRRANRREA